MSPAVLVEQVSGAGFRIDVTEHGPQLVSVVAGARLPRELLAELKANREQVVRYLTSPREAETEEESCSLCGRTGITAQDRPRLLDPAFCDRGGAKATRTMPAEPRCPFKP